MRTFEQRLLFKKGNRGNNVPLKLTYKRNNWTINCVLLLLLANHNSGGFRVALQLLCLKPERAISLSVFPAQTSYVRSH